MSSEHPLKTEFFIPILTNQQQEQDPEIAQLFDIPDHLQHSFTPLDSHLQGVLLRADALVSDNNLNGKHKMTPQKRIEDESLFLDLTYKFGVSPNPYELSSLGGYNTNGANIKEHREKILKTGDTDIGKLVEIISFDKDGRADTISQAAD